MNDETSNVAKIKKRGDNHLSPHLGSTVVAKGEHLGIAIGKVACCYKRNKDHICLDSSLIVVC